MSLDDLKALLNDDATYDHLAEECGKGKVTCVEDIQRAYLWFYSTLCLVVLDKHKATLAPDVVQSLLGHLGRAAIEFRRIFGDDDGHHA